MVSSQMFQLHLAGSLRRVEQPRPPRRLRFRDEFQLKYDSTWRSCESRLLDSVPTRFYRYWDYLWIIVRGKRLAQIALFSMLFHETSSVSASTFKRYFDPSVWDVQWKCDVSPKTWNRLKMMMTCRGPLASHAGCARKDSIFGDFSVDEAC